MTNSRKAVLATVAALAGATGLTSWAADPYYDGYTYDRYGNRYERYGNAEPYYYFDGRRFDSERDYRNYRDFRRRELRRDFRDFEADCAEPYATDGQGNPRGHGGPCGTNPRDGGSPG